MGMSGAYGVADREESIATVHAALAAGVTLIDTGDFYGMGHNELLLAEALRGRDRDSYQLSVKFGMLRGPGGEFGGFDGRPEAVKTFLAYSLTRLGTDYIDIRSEEHTSELQSRENLVCRLLLEKKKKI